MTTIDDQAMVMRDRLTSITAITNADDYREVGELWKAGREMMKQIDEAYDSIIASAHKAHKEALAKKKSFYKPLEDATRNLKRMMAAYDAEQERARREEQARLEAEARKREEERRLAEAAAVEEAGDQEAAEKILNEEITLPPVAVPKATPKVEGVVLREIWRFRIIDQSAIPREYLVPDELKIGAVVRALKGSASIPGIEIYSEKV